MSRVGPAACGGYTVRCSTARLTRSRSVAEGSFAKRCEDERTYAAPVFATARGVVFWIRLL